MKSIHVQTGFVSEIQGDFVNISYRWIFNEFFSEMLIRFYPGNVRIIYAQFLTLFLTN